MKIEAEKWDGLIESLAAIIDSFGELEIRKGIREGKIYWRARASITTRNKFVQNFLESEYPDFKRYRLGKCPPAKVYFISKTELEKILPQITLSGFKEEQRRVMLKALKLSSSDPQNEEPSKEMDDILKSSLKLDSQRSNQTEGTR
jgi:hypothetical protein